MMIMRMIGCQLWPRSHPKKLPHQEAPPRHREPAMGGKGIFRKLSFYKLVLRWSLPSPTLQDPGASSLRHSYRGRPSWGWSCQSSEPPRTGRHVEPWRNSRETQNLWQWCSERLPETLLPCFSRALNEWQQVPTFEILWRPYLISAARD